MQTLISFAARSIAAAAMFVLAATAAHADESDLARNLEVDRQLAAFDDPLILRQQLALPAVWPGPRGAPPFNQEPPGAQGNFCPGTPQRIGLTIPINIVILQPGSCP